MVVSDSILGYVKNKLPVDNDEFDDVLIGHINSEFAKLNQMGVGPENLFTIDGPDNTWDEFMYASSLREFVKDYIWINVKLIFDPPLNSKYFESLEKRASQLEFRMQTEIGY